MFTMARKFEKSFYDWCIENNHEDYLELWDYKMNNYRPKDIGYSSNKKYWFKCSKGIHESELKSLNHITRTDRTLSCEKCNSFGQWCIENNHENWLELWDYEMNNCSPFEISRRSGKRYYFKCPRGLHESKLNKIDNLIDCNNLYCNQCNSIGQYLIDKR